MNKNITINMIIQKDRLYNMKINNLCGFYSRCANLTTSDSKNKLYIIQVFGPVLADIAVLNLFIVDYKPLNLFHLSIS